MRKKWKICGIMLSVSSALLMYSMAFRADSTTECACLGICAVSLAVCAALSFDRSFDRKE